MANETKQVQVTQAEAYAIQIAIGTHQKVLERQMKAATNEKIKAALQEETNYYGKIKEKFPV